MKTPDVRHSHRRDRAAHTEDLLCFSHLRWDFVFQRPQHLLTRAARTRRVFYIEEPRADAHRACLETRRDPSGVTIVIPHLPREVPEPDATVHSLIDFLLSGNDIHTYISWYYTPMALRWSSHLRPIVTVYDCMDELSAFAGAPAGIVGAEQALLKRASLVFTGGHSLYCAKRPLHPHVYEFASGVDVDHFITARQPRPDPADQSDIPHPRIGFFGVLDERLDRDLLAGVAAAAPGWHLVMLGPVTKIDPKALPVAPNLHYLGPKAYAQLPDYVANWEVAMLPFARNDATRFISPTKTPEYLAAGRPVVSTSITDVVTPYRDLDLVRIADTAPDFVDAIREALCERPDDRVMRADAILQRMSWDDIWSRMSELVDDACRAHTARATFAPVSAAQTRSSRL